MPSDAKRELINSVGHDLRILSRIVSENQLSPIGYREIESSSYALRKDRAGVDVLAIELAGIDLQIDNNLRYKPPSIELEDRLLVDITFEQNLVHKKIYFLGAWHGSQCL